MRDNISRRMKRKILEVTFFAIVFLLGVPGLTRAQQEQATVSATSSAKIDYQLPYPGILPDSPIYFLKTLRDKIISFLISDPLKKAEFNLRVADKRLASGLVLLDRGKEELAVSTISKGENYLEMAIDKTIEVSKKGKDTSLIDQNLIRAAEKHQQALQDAMSKIGQQYRGRLEKELQRVEFFKKSVSVFSNR